MEGRSVLNRAQVNLVHLDDQPEPKIEAKTNSGSHTLDAIAA
jgi:hypothetical protein